MSALLALGCTFRYMRGYKGPGCT